MARKKRPRYPKGHKKAGKFMSNRAIAARKSARSRKRKRSRSSSKRKRKRRSNPGRTTRRRRRSRAKRNPRTLPVLQQFTDGVVGAGQILIGKAAVRSIPDIAQLPKEGNVGLAIQAGTALAIGYVAEMFLSRDASMMMTAGALTAPLETLIVMYDVPWVGRALSPTSQANDMAAYSRRKTLGRYARRRALPAGAGGSTERGLGRYATERGVTTGYD